MSWRQFHSWKPSLPQIIFLANRVHALESRHSLQKEANYMGLTRPLNVLAICAAFAFVGALIMGVLP